MKKFIILLFFTLITLNNSYTSTNKDYFEKSKPSMSLWYQLCFTSSGTFKFYIDPTGNKNNFNFAVWNNATYPPTTSPIRCSQSTVLPNDTCDYTGLGNSANDLNESTSGDGWLLPLTVTAGQCIIINISNYDSDSNNFKLYLGGTALALPIFLIDFYVR